MTELSVVALGGGVVVAARAALGAEQQQDAPMRRLLGLLRPQLGRLVLAALLAALAQLCGVGLIAVAGWLISRASQQPPILDLQIAIVAVRAFGLGRGVIRYTERLVGHDAALALLTDLRVACYERLERLAPAGLPAGGRGDLLARLVADVDAVQDLYLRVLVPYAAAGAVGAAACLLLGSLVPLAGLVLALCLVSAGGLVPVLAARADVRAGTQLAPLRGTMTQEVLTTVQHLPELAVYGALGEQLARQERADAALTAAVRRSGISTSVAAAAVSLLAGLATWAALLIGVPAVADGALDPVALAVLVLVPLAVFETFSGLSTAAQSLVQVRRSAARVFEVLDAPDPASDPVAPVPLPPEFEGGASATDSPTSVGLAVRGLEISWVGGAPVLHGVDLDLATGQVIALVGPSGSGKSTLASALVRFLNPTAGTITLTAAATQRSVVRVDTATLSGDDVRRVIGLGGQDAFVFDTSLAENLRLARPGCDDADLWWALEQAGLADEVQAMPRALATMVGEHGGRLSGGQRQRLSLARLLLAAHRFVVLDEPAEHLDAAAGDALTTDLLTTLPAAGRGVLLVTHRLLGLEVATEIIVLIAGQVVQRGRVAELLAEPGWFADQYQRQRVGPMAAPMGT